MLSLIVLKKVILLKAKKKSIVEMCFKIYQFVSPPFDILSGILTIDLPSQFYLNIDSLRFDIRPSLCKAFCTSLMSGNNLISPRAAIDTGVSRIRLATL